jgi:competence ComEA-like helix-hairpin-helix protein
MGERRYPMSGIFRRAVLVSVAGLAVGVLAAVVPAGAFEFYGEQAATTASSELGLWEKVNVNTASLEDLALVEGISEDMAKAIVEFRDENGPLVSLDELLEVEGIGAKELNAFRDRVTVETYYYYGP